MLNVEKHTWESGPKSFLVCAFFAEILFSASLITLNTESNFLDDVLLQKVSQKKKKSVLIRCLAFLTILIIGLERPQVRNWD